mmetsp:Transcript_12893/g.21213  ORF Transcript_12893/g.21213 Transcript_12893/m.21213 type:complete len:205 (-) Transcript_12893:157-771(-)
MSDRAFYQAQEISFERRSHQELHISLGYHRVYPSWPNQRDEFGTSQVLLSIPAHSIVVERRYHLAQHRAHGRKVLWPILLRYFQDVINTKVLAYFDKICANIDSNQLVRVTSEERLKIVWQFCHIMRSYEASNKFPAPVNVADLNQCNFASVSYRSVSVQCHIPLCIQADHISFCNIRHGSDCVINLLHFCEHFHIIFHEIFFL